MRVALAQVNYHIGHFAYHEEAILALIRKAKAGGADLIVFSELAVCGYPPCDLLELPGFIAECEASLNRIAACCDGIAAIVGVPSRNPGSAGKKLYNSACFIENKRIKTVVHKTLLPTYDIFDEYRYFEPNTDFGIIPFCGERIALTICEDLWDVGENQMYTRWPMEELSKQNPTLMINIAASPFHHGQDKVRREILRKNVLMYKVPLIYVNQVGAQTELLFDGGSLVMNAQGEVIRSLSYFTEDFAITDTNTLNDLIAPCEVPEREKMALVHDALVMGIRDYFQKLGFTKAILGLSGGIDSAVVLALASEALGAANVKALLLPSRYSSDHSIEDAIRLAECQGNPYETIPIEEGFSAFENTLNRSFAGTKPDLTEENIQARIRGVILMAFSNKFGYILLNTSNKSEAAVGYGTLYGDMCGGLSVIGDLYKTEVYALARYINRNEEVIPDHILTKPPSAELRPDQKDEDSLPPYHLLDQILFQYIEEQKTPQEIIASGLDETMVMKALKLVNISEHKRRQSPPTLRVSSKAFGYGRRMPIVAKYLC
jgi:NAD+ synthase (glutamine-hydrolysing)